MKSSRIVAFCAALAVAALYSCKEESGPDFYSDDLVIDSGHNRSEGSYVQGVELGIGCTAVISYDNASGGSAEFSAPANNGMWIDPQTFALSHGSGEVELAVSGTPLELELTYLQINVKYKGKTYISSVEINVLEDMDPSGEVIFTISSDNLISLLDAVELPFSVTPTMAAVTVVAPEGLRASVSSDKSTGQGSITLTPSANFLSGDIVVTASFGARAPRSVTIESSAFASGEGTAASPWRIDSGKTLDKIRYGLSNAYILSNDIVLSEPWVPVGTATAPFAGRIDGAGHSVSFNVSIPEDNAAFFAYVASAASLSSLTLEGSVQGASKVAALAANSEAAISADVSGVTVLGDDLVAEKIASGSARDSRIISFGEVPARVNITAGETSYSAALGLTDPDVDVIFNAGTTGLTCSYEKSNGKFSLVRDEHFVPGDILFYVRLGSDRVRSRARTIAVTSKSMYESGSGVEGDPYIVVDAEQLAATMLNYPSSHISLGADSDASEWESPDSFSGVLDGASHVLSGLKTVFVKTLSGTVKNIAFADVDVTAGSTNCGVVANLLEGKVLSVALSGKLTAASASAGDTGLSAIAGQASGKAVIDNCCSKVEISVSGSNFATGGIVGVIKSSSGITISRCTVEGNISITSNATKVGGILGRKTNASQNSGDKIEDCLVSAAVNVSGGSSNMIGGVFGALQGATVDGDYVGGITVRRTAFTGAVSAGTAVGGICGVGCSVSDCFVSGSVQATNNTGGTGGSAGIVSAAKGNVTRCVVAGSRISGTNLSSFSTAGIISKQNGNAPVANSCVVIGASLQAEGKTILGSVSNLTASGCKWWGVTYLDGVNYLPSTPDQDGSAFSSAPQKADFEQLGYDFNTVWNWNSAGYPELKSAGCETGIVNMIAK